MTNSSLVSEFIILGLTTRPELEKNIFIVFLIIYMVALIGNLIIFLLSIFDSATVPKMLTAYVTKSKVISYYGCVAQLFFFTWPTGVELLLLTVMAYDRYIAIGNPLRYATIINRKVCIHVAIIITIIGFLNSLTHTNCTFRLPYCDDNKINHFFCEIMPLLKLACADTYINEIVVLTSNFILGKRKAFSTCASHITIVSMYYGAVIFTYIRPRSILSLEKDKIVSALYAVITPTLNPIIYSLRNKEVKEAFKRTVKRLIQHKLKSMT
ncbi:hypothetical protein GDO78_017612 [Eleutherodactylus coqui]|uniref:Olfactory receptor n=1 Tax=Eleutherodactylus coqui TaxID=57060 RepID=A0A8J6C2R9_ELECQ|nr:hypothetical protein GDO78_017612 [Eleutherodactylus coqui]